MPFCPKLADFSAVCIADTQGTSILQNPHLNLVILDHAQRKTLIPGNSYLITISQIQSTPDVVIPAEDDLGVEEHA